VPKKPLEAYAPGKKRAQWAEKQFAGKGKNGLTDHHRPDKWFRDLNEGYKTC